MINEYIRCRIAPDRAAAFVEAYTAAKESLEASTHCLGYELSRCTEDAEAFVLKIQWDSAEGHLQGFRRSPQFPPFLKPPARSAAARAVLPGRGAHPRDVGQRAHAHGGLYDDDPRHRWMRETCARLSRG